MSDKIPLRRTTLTIATIVTLTLQVGLSSRTNHPYWQLLTLCVTIVLATIVGCRRVPCFFGAWQQLLRCTAFACLIGCDGLFEMFSRFALSFGNPYEVLLALTLRNLMFGFVAGQKSPRDQSFAMLIGLVLVLFSLLTTASPWTITLFFVYVLVGSWWLMGIHWVQLSDAFPATTKQTVPWAPFALQCGLLTVAGFVCLYLTNSIERTTAVHGFFPSSGGTQRSDSYAYGGIGDGPQLVRARKNASSFGAIESELFLESKMPSLFDVLNEFSNAPPQIQRMNRRRAIPLAPSLMAKNHERRATNQRPGREFETVRRRSPERRMLGDLYASSLLLQVQGRVPVHLGLQTYDQWDGTVLSSSSLIATESVDFSRDFEAPDSPLARLIAFLTRNPNTVAHTIRIINLKTDRVPSPPGLFRADVGQNQSVPLFCRTTDGMLAIEMDFIPQLTVLHTRSHSDRPLDALSFGPKAPTNRAQALSRDGLQQESPTAPGATSVGNSLRSLALEWTRGIPAGWPQVEAVCQQLRSNYIHDVEAEIPDDVHDSVEYFLFKAKRGPDYLFATSAALLLRELGYETRVVSGFYARPENYDRAARCTSVYAEDAHFWAEVLKTTPNERQVRPEEAYRADWIAIEPTPGYVPPQVTGASSEIALKFAALFQWGCAHPWFAFLGFAVIAGCCIWRRNLSDFGLTGIWYLSQPFLSPRGRVQSTIRLLERRASLLASARPTHLPLGRWRLTTAPDRGTPAEWERRLWEIANCVLYGDESTQRPSVNAIHTACSRAIANGFRNPNRHRMRHLRSLPFAG